VQHFSYFTEIQDPFDEDNYVELEFETEFSVGPPDPDVGIFSVYVDDWAVTGVTYLGPDGGTTHDQDLINILVSLADYDKILDALHVQAREG
jgi:hypothetical protein